MGKDLFNFVSEVMFASYGPSGVATLCPQWTSGWPLWTTPVHSGQSIHFWVSRWIFVNVLVGTITVAAVALPDVSDFVISLYITKIWSFKFSFSFGGLMKRKSASKIKCI